jgi:hypothetical protein
MLMQLLPERHKLRRQPIGDAHDSLIYFHAA